MRWEFQEVYPGRETVTAERNRMFASLGDKGWELCATSKEGTFWFKRPKIEVDTKPAATNEGETE